MQEKTKAAVIFICEFFLFFSSPFSHRYDIMYLCWNVDSKLRSSLDDLENSISNLLFKDIAKHYIDLNESYSKRNSKISDADQPDYLAQMADPCYEIPLEAPNGSDGRSNCSTRSINYVLCLFRINSSEAFSAAIKQ